MGITASYRRITPDNFAEVQSNPEIAKNFFWFDLDDIDFSDLEAMNAKFEEQKAKQHYFSIEKEWHALHFLLTGESGSQGDTNPLPHSNVVFGGTPTQFKSSLGFIRYLNPQEVKEVADLLSTISVEELSRRFDADAFNNAMIYPLAPDDWDEEEIEPLLEVYYPQLVDFFQDAAKSGDIVLLSSD